MAGIGSGYILSVFVPIVCGQKKDELQASTLAIMSPLTACFGTPRGLVRVQALALLPRPCCLGLAASASASLGSSASASLGATASASLAASVLASLGASLGASASLPQPRQFCFSSCLCLEKMPRLHHCIIVHALLLLITRWKRNTLTMNRLILTVVWIWRLAILGCD